MGDNEDLDLELDEDHIGNFLWPAYQALREDLGCDCAQAEAPGQHDAQFDEIVRSPFLVDLRDGTTVEIEEMALPV